jgi:2-amino-4-hydroxy-6-hydroxymethyldihydropteridine diphosphokinase
MEIFQLSCYHGYMTEVYLALGSNVGDSKVLIKQATELLSHQLSDIKQAPLYRSKAVGYTDQPDFVNTAVSGQTELEPKALLSFIKEVERQVGRTATFHWGPREIDIDIILYGDIILETEALTIPHPEFRQRDFVLRPLVDLNPDVLDPVSQQTVQDLYDGLDNSQKSVI